MRTFAAMIVITLCLFTVVRLGMTGVSARVQQPANAAAPAFYAANVSPILQANCARCHSGINHRGGYSIATRDSMIKGGSTGPAIIPGHPEQSLLLKLVRQHDLTGDQKPMPPKGRLSDPEIAVLEQWIRAGAAVPGP